jgi:hypothetical protein
MGSEKFCLRWNDFEKNISGAFRELREDKDFFDVTLACEDSDQLLAHKVILSACSPFFRTVLRRNPHQHPLLYLKGVKYTDLQSVLNFMYHGEVNVAQDELNSFLAVAEDLRVKGLTQNDQQPGSGGGNGSAAAQTNKSGSGNSSSFSRPKSPAAGSSSGNKNAARDSHRDLMSVGGPPSKRPRSSLPSVCSNSVPAAAPAKPPPPDDDDDDIEEVIPVKSEPRDNTASGGGIVANTDMYGAAAAVGSGGGQSQALAQEEDMVYGGQDESYDDYEQYGGEGDGGGGYDDGALLDPSLAGGADGNKGRTSLLYFNMRLCKGKIRTQLFLIKCNK